MDNDKQSRIVKIKKYNNAFISRKIMLIDTHCHINMMVKKEFDTPLTKENIFHASTIVNDAIKMGVEKIINVGTSLIESINCITLAANFPAVYAAIGIHPNDCTAQWHDDFLALAKKVADHQKHKIIGIGECGIDRHYPDYNLPRQQDAFRAQIELALEYALPLIVHTRNAPDETLAVLDQYNKEPLRGIIHCFSEDQSFADEVINRGFCIGIGGTITYPKNELLRTVAQQIPLGHMVLETDAPFLPPQSIRGKQNHPQEIVTIAHFVAEVRTTSFEEIAQQTTKNVLNLFNVNDLS